jgi:hypothetical protein
MPVTPEAASVQEELWLRFWPYEHRPIAAVRTRTFELFDIVALYKSKPKAAISNCKSYAR